MSSLHAFIDANDVLIGIVGTLIVILAVLAGYGRHHEAATADRAEKRPANPSGNELLD